MAKRKKSFKKSAKKSVKRKKFAKKYATKKVARKRKPLREPGYTRRRKSGIYVPDGTDGEAPIPAGMLSKGIEEAKSQMRDMVYEIASTMGDEYDLSQVEFEASFSADGKFLGFGVGGAATIKIQVRPSDE